MLNFTDIIVFAGMFLLRFGLPLAVTVGLVYVLKRLDRRWEEEARAYQATQKAAEKAAEQPAPRPVERPAPVKRTPTPEPKLPFIPPPARETPRPQPGLVAGQAAEHCWDTKGCSESAKAQCAAPKHPELPCWQARFDAEGQIPEDCVNCDTFQRFPLM